MSYLLNKPANRLKKSKPYLKVILCPYVKLLLKLKRQLISELLSKLVQVNNYELNRSRSSSYDVVIKVRTDMSKQIIFNISFLETDLKIVTNVRPEIHGTVNESSEWTAE